ncbi:unnamed protein product, partial [Adineta steineri]
MITQEQPSIVSLTIKHRVHDIDLVHLLKFLPNLKTLSTTLCMYPKLYEFENCSNLTSLEFDVTGIGLTDIEEYLFKMFPHLNEALIVDFTPSPHIRNFITDKIEEQLGLDINKDGRIGGPGPMNKIEQTTHIDLNHDGIIGGYRPPAGGANHRTKNDDDDDSSISSDDSDAEYRFICPLKDGAFLTQHQL